MGDFNEQELSNTAWAFATVRQKDVPLFAAVATAAQQDMGDFNPQTLANTAWAFATSGQSDAQMFPALVR